MAREFAKEIYNSRRWKQTRDAYARSVGGLCERCLRKSPPEYNAGVIVHHKIHITPQNMNKPEIVWSWNNLELLCRQCHAEEHDEIYQQKKKSQHRRWRTDDSGNVIITDEKK